MRRSWTTAALALSLAGAGCQDGDGSEDPSPEVEAEAIPSRLAPRPVRRLTATEYRNTVRDLFPGVALPEQRFAATSPVDGFDNNADAQDPSALLIEQFRSAAGQIADVAAERVAPDCPPDDEACLRAWVTDLGARAFRRPMTWSERLDFGGLATQWASKPGVGVLGGVRLVIRAMLQAPQFLYRLELGSGSETPDIGDRVGLTPWEQAARLSYLLWATMPDEALRLRAAGGGLASADEVVAEAERMLDDPRATDAILEFHRQWLELDRVSRVNKDPDAFPEFNASVRRAMREEPDRFLAAVLDGGDGRIPDLLTEPFTFVDDHLAAIYGVERRSDDLWERVDLDPEQRGGVLTQPHFLAAQAHVVHPSPVLRGVFVLDRLLCARPPPPDATVNLAVADEQPDAPPATNRERYAAHVADPQCAGCHADIDGIGFAFEGYDAIGAFRLDDAGEPVDATGRIMLDGRELPLNGAIDLARKLATSPEVDACVVRQWFRFTYGRDATPAEVEMLADLAPRWRFQGHRILDLLVELVVAGGIAP